MSFDKEKTILPLGWSIASVKEISSEMGDAPFGAKLKSKDYIENGIPVIQGRNIKNNKFEWNNKLYVSEEKKNELKKHLCKTGDLVFPKVGTIGGCAILPVIEGKREFVLSTNMMKLNVDENSYSLKYIYYFFSNPKIQNTIKQFSTSSVQPVFNFTSLKKFLVVLPKLEEQRSIADLLLSLDDKIELNNAINKNLEEMAQALFKRWFVDFEFPNENGEPYKSSGGEFEESELGLIPKGWRVGVLSELISVKYGKDHKKLDDGSIPVYGSGGVMRYVDKALYNGESVLIPRKGSLNNVIYINEPFWSVDTMFYTEMNMSYIAKFVYLFVCSKDLVSMNVGSAVPSMTTDILNKMPVIIPPKYLFEEFDRIASALFDKIQMTITESKNLTVIRDTLLPKLMSGEIRVPLDQA